jgi:hypothetical protein
MTDVEHCEVFGQARERAQQTLAECGTHEPADLSAVTSAR